MIRHVVLFRWKEGTPDSAVEAAIAGLRAMPAEIGEIREYRFGRDLGIAPSTWDFVVIADFDSAEDYRTYRDHPRHRAFIDEHITPHLDERAAVQFDLG